MIMNATQKTRVPWAMSDLFFNTDVSDAEMFDGKGIFLGYDDDRMLQIAKDFLACMTDLGADHGVTPEDLAADFYSRV